MNKIRLLFDNGNYYCVNCSVYSPMPGNPKPADAFIVSESEGDFTVAARNAAHAAYTCLESRGEKLSPCTAGIELSEKINSKANIAGESCGLCFAVAFAKAVLKSEIPDIAATGVINAHGDIKKVKGIAAKLKTAAELTDINGFVFYPEENNYDIPDELASIFTRKQIRCHAVSHVDKVFDILFKPLRRKTFFTAFTKIKILIAMVIALIIAVVSYFYFHLLPVTAEKMSGSISAGKIITKPALPAPASVKNKMIKAKSIKVKSSKSDSRGFD